MEQSSFIERNIVLNVPFEAKEVEHALKHLKLKRSVGPDNLSLEHLRCCGPIFTHWLFEVYNCICDLEQIPRRFKLGFIVPVFKGKGRDPLLINSYRGITLTSVLAKDFELLLLNRMNDVSEDAEVPQTAYRKNVGCSDSIFAS